jgi:hypothetical protein
MTREHRIDLVCHPASPSAAVRGIQAVVNRAVGGGLHLTYLLDGDIPRLRIPAPSAPVFNATLWRRTCFESFIAIAGDAAYHEFNFSPSGEWAVFAFKGYRDGGALEDESLRPPIKFQSAGNHLRLDALVRVDRLASRHLSAPLLVGIAAVIEEEDRRSYWAIRHPHATPDFHRLDGFGLRLDLA